MDQTCPLPDTYDAIDGTAVAVPPPPALSDGPMPYFDPEDRGWLDQLLAFRDQVIARESGMPPAPDMTDVPEDMRDAVIEMHKAQVQRGRGQSAEITQRKQAADAEFGPDGAGFIAQLNDGRAIADFWATLDRLLYQRIPLMQYQAPKEHQIICDILTRFPQPVWLRLLSQIQWPAPKGRKAMPLESLMAAFITGPQGDFRHLETGSAKPTRDTDIDAKTQRDILVRLFQLQRSFDGFCGAIVPADSAPLDPAAMVAKGQDTAAILRAIDSPAPLSDAERIEIETYLAGFKPARSYADGTTQSAMNLFKLQCYSGVMAQVMPGPHEGKFLLQALCQIPSGARGMEFSAYPRDMVWPYIATHLDILDRALGLSAPFAFDPKFSPAKALALLRFLPKLPARYGDTVFAAAIGKTKPGRQDAQALLAGVTGYVDRGCAALSDTSAIIRAEAARTLASIGSPKALAALQARAEVETMKSVQVALADAITALAAVNRSKMSYDMILQEYHQSASDMAALPDWVAALAPKGLRLSDGTPAPTALINWLLALALAHGRPDGSGFLDDRLAVLDARSRSDLADAVIAGWCAYDAQPYPPESVAATYQEALDERYHKHKMFWDVRESFSSPEYDRAAPMSRDEIAAFAHDEIMKRAEMFRNWKPYLFSGLKTKGLLGFAPHASPDHLSAITAQYLADHGKRAAQCKALLDCLKAGNKTAAIAEVAAQQPQKGLRTYATNMLAIQTNA